MPHKSRNGQCFQPWFHPYIDLILAPIVIWSITSLGVSAGQSDSNPHDSSLFQPPAAVSTESLHTPTASSKAVELPAGVSPSWWTEVQGRIAAQEYHFSPMHSMDRGMEASSAGWQAPNRSQNLRLRFGSDGLTVTPRLAADATPWSLTLRVREIAGYPGWSDAVEVRAEGNRLRYLRGAGVEEWYENRPEGLEQGFTLRQPLTSGGVVTVDLDVVGGLRPVLDQDGIYFCNNSGVRVLHYSNLWVTDASGRELPARMKVTTDGLIRITAVVSDALYPVVIDPLLTTVVWSSESDQLNAYFGWSVATTGDVNGDGYSDIIVGAPWYDNGQFNEGLALVYHGSSTGPATAPAWTAEGNQASALYGSSVATAGDVNGDGYSDIIVGAPNYDNDEIDEGRVFVYHGSASGLSTVPARAVESNQEEVFFGAAVASAGDVNGDGFSDVIIGAPHYDNGQTDEGRVFVFHGSTAGLSPASVWTAEGNQVNARFGSAVALAGDVNGDGFSDVVIGSPTYDNGQSDEGGAFVYHGSAAGLSVFPA